MTPEDAALLADLIAEDRRGSGHYFSSRKQVLHNEMQRLCKSIQARRQHRPVSSNRDSNIFGPLLSLEPPYRRYIPNYELLVQEIYCRDHGICAKCGINTLHLYQAIHYCLERFEAASPGWGTEWHWQESFEALRRAIGLRAQRWPKRLWDIDHIIPVKHGGSDKMENLRTLCLLCHRKETNRQIYGRT